MKKQLYLVAFKIYEAKRMIKENEIYVKQEPYVDDNGIYIPLNEYALQGCTSAYECIMTKEVFIEAYNKWIKNDKT